MVSVDQLARLLLACVLLIAVPGPSVLFVIGRALSHGRSTALASVAGNCTGSYLAGACVAFGLGPLLQRWAPLLDVIRFAGAAYLVWLGVVAIRRSAHAALAVAGAGTEQSTARAVRAGVIVGLSNPKVFIVFAAVVPQFVDRSTGHVTSQMLLLSVVPVLIGLVTDSLWALAAGRARNWLSKTPRRSVAVASAGGVSMIGLGVSVAISGSST